MNSLHVLFGPGKIISNGFCITEGKYSFFNFPVAIKYTENITKTIKVTGVIGIGNITGFEVKFVLLLLSPFGTIFFFFENRITKVP